jgi:sec-independent protein translocase protein TatA
VGFLREPSHLLLILVVVVVLFGSRRLPDAARGLGRSMRIFKSEVKQMKEDDADTGRQPGETRAAADAEPLEGRVVRNDPTVRSEPRAGEVRRDA